MRASFLVPGIFTTIREIIAGDLGLLVDGQTNAQISTPWSARSRPSCIATPWGCVTTPTPPRTWCRRPSCAAGAHATSCATPRPHAPGCTPSCATSMRGSTSASGRTCATRLICRRCRCAAMTPAPRPSSCVAPWRSWKADYRDPLLLQVIGGFSCKEIGQMLDLNTNTVLTRLFRARKALREQLTEQPQQEANQ